MRSPKSDSMKNLTIGQNITLGCEFQLPDGNTTQKVTKHVNLTPLGFFIFEASSYQYDGTKFLCCPLDHVLHFFGHNIWSILFNTSLVFIALSDIGQTLQDNFKLIIC